MTPEEARRHTRLKFRAREAVREDYHAEEGLPFPMVVGGAALTMALLGIAASAIPALRALAVDPSTLDLLRRGMEHAVNPDRVGRHNSRPFRSA